MALEHITSTTKPGDLVKVEVPKWCEVYVNKAVAQYSKMLTVVEFVHFTGFELDMKSFDVLFMNISDDGIPVVITEELLDWMGYEGKTFANRQQDFQKALRNNFTEGEEFFVLGDKAYGTWRTKFLAKSEMWARHICEKALPLRSNTKKTHVIAMPDTFRAQTMMLKTSKGAQIRKYYIQLEKLIKAYVIYQALSRNKEAEYAMTCKDTKIDDLKQMLLEDRKNAEEKEKNVEERFQRLIGVAEDTKETLQDTKQEVLKTNHKLDQVIKDRVVMKNVSSKKKELLYIYRLRTAYDSEQDYYSFRCQTGNIDALVSAREQRLSERRVKRWNKKKKLTNANIKKLVMKLPREEIPKLIKIKEIGYTSYLPNAVIFWDKYMEENISSGVITNCKNGAFDIE